MNNGSKPNNNGSKPNGRRPVYKRILVRGVNRIGDTVFILPGIKALAEAYPEASITLLCKEGPSELFRNNPHVNEIIILNEQGEHKGVFGHLKLVAELKKRKFDLAVNFHNSFVSALEIFLARIPERVGYIKEQRGLLLTRRLPFPGKPVHRIEMKGALCGLVGAGLKQNTPEIHVSEKERQAAKQTLSRRIACDGPVIGIIPGSSAKTRSWFPERFAAVGDRLIENHGASILILGGKGDRERAGVIETSMKHPCINLTGELTLRELIALLEQTDLVISNDTGPMHIAWSLKRPVITFFGAGDPVETGPRGNSSVVISKPLDCGPCIKEVCPTGELACLKAVTVEDVYLAAAELLEAGICAPNPY